LWGQIPFYVYILLAMTENGHYRILEKFLQKEATSSEIRQLSEWLCRPESQKELSDYFARKWESAPHTIDLELQSNMLEVLREKIAPRPKQLPHRMFKVMKYVAAIVLPFVIGVGSYLLADKISSSRDKDMVVSVDNGQKAALQLPDGTKVWLNSGSHIRYDKSYNKQDRIVSFEGEAYFEVAKDKKRPFIVKVGAVSVRAVGTAFNVKGYDNDNTITATLMEGKIDVFDSKSSIRLSPNEKITFDKNRLTFEKAQIYDANIASQWKNNRLAFDSETLEDIGKALERMYNVQMVFDTEAIKQIRFSGTIKNNSLESVLQLISLTSPIDYSIQNSIVTLKFDKNKKD
jgi:transmembrane sensor